MKAKKHNPFKLREFRGVDSIETMAGWEPEPLRRMVTEFVERTGFDGITPLSKEVRSTVANARKMPKVLEDSKE